MTELAEDGVTHVGCPNAEPEGPLKQPEGARFPDTGCDPSPESSRIAQFAVDQSPLACSWIRPDGSYAYVNDAGCRLLGYSREELLRQKVAEVNPSMTLERWQSVIERLEREKSLTYEAMFLTKQGASVWVEATTSLIETGNGPLVCGFARDITERKAAERRRLKESERIGLLLELHQRAAGMTDSELFDSALAKAVKLTDSRIGFFHRVTEDQSTVLLSIWNQEARQDRTIADNYPVEQAGNWVDCIRQGGPVVYNDCSVAPNQKGLPADHVPVNRFMAIPVIEENKVRFIFGVGNKSDPYDADDVLQVQLVANEVQKIMVHRAADEKLRLQALMLDQIADTVTATDLRGVITYVNEAQVRALGCAREELIGRSVESFGDDPEQGATQRQIIEDTSRWGSWRGEVVNRDAAGREFLMEARTALLKSGSGEPIGMIGAGTDITARRKAEEALKQSRLELILKQKIAHILLTASDAVLFAELSDLLREEFGSPSGRLACLDATGDRVGPEIVQSGRHAVTVPVMLKSDLIGQIVLEGRNQDFTEREKATLLGIAEYLAPLLKIRLERDHYEAAHLEAESALRRSEEFLKATEEFSKVGGWQWDIRSQQTLWTDETYRIHGLEPASGVPRSADQIARSLECYDPEDRPKLLEALRRCSTDGTPYSMDLPITTSKGERIWIHTAARPVRENGVIVRVLGNIAEITERKQVEETLRWSEERFRTVADFTYDWEYWLTAEGRFLYVSPSCERISGYSSGEFLHNSNLFLRIIHPDDRSLVASRLQSTEDCDSFDFRIHTRDGEVRWISQVSQLVSSRDGSPLGRRGSLRDITDRKMLESSLAEAARRLREAERIALLGHYTIRFSDGRAEWSDETFRIFGLDPGPGLEPTAETYRDLVHPDDVERVYEMFGRSLREGTPFDLCYRIRRADGEVRWVHSQSRVVRGVSGVAEALFGTIQDVTQQRNIEEALKASEARWRSYLDNAPVGVLVADSEGRHVESNRTAEILLGYEPKELLNTRITDLPAEESVEEAAEHFRKVVEEGSAEGLFKLRRKDGGWIWASVKAARLGSDYHLAVFQDVTERHTSIERITEAHRTVSAVLDAVPDLLVVVDRSFRILYTNAKGHDRILPTDPEKFNTCYGRYKLLDAPCEDCSALPVFLTGKTVEREMVNPADGRLREVRAFPIQGENGEVVAVVEHVRDVTERRRAEDALHTLSQAVEQSPAGVILTDAEGSVEYVNRRFCELTGYTLEEVRGKSLWTLQSGETPKDIYRDLQGAMLKGVPWQREILNRKKSGEQYWERFGISPITNAQGVVTHFLGAKEDITERKRAEQEHADLQTQLFQAQKMEAIGQLAGGVAHDFNNIMAAVMMHLDLLKSDPAVNAEQLELLSELELEARRAVSLTRQLLLFSRRSLVQLKTLDLNEVVVDMMKMLRRLLGERIEVVIQRQALPCWVKADPGMVEQVVMNLSVNARDAMPKGGRLLFSVEPVDIDASYAGNHPDSREGQFVRLVVEDTGIGMDQATMERIFHPFFTTKEVGKGTGLGLATVYGIVKQHEGWVEVESRLGQGTRFRVYFPFCMQYPADNPSETTGQIRTGGKETLLIVEDEAGVRRVLAVYLRRLGYTVLEAESGSKAMSVWEGSNHEISLVLTDMVLPGELNGLDLIEVFRADKPTLPVIIHSGYSTDLLEAGSEASGVFYVPKPCEPRRLSEVIRQALERGPGSPLPV